MIDLGQTVVQKAIATDRNGHEFAGVIVGQQARFAGLIAGDGYDVTLTISDEEIIRVIDLSWYALTPPDEAAGPLDDDDRGQITAICRDIKTFADRNEILKLIGGNGQAVALVECTRNRDFHARKGDEIVWRIEVWYFENQAGGWAKVAQQNRVLDRQRFASKQAFDAYRARLRWVGASSLRAGVEGKITFVLGNEKNDEKPSKKPD